MLPESLEGQRNAELEAHLTSCAACSELVADLKTITREAAFLREADEPSPRVWNMIEAELRREGVIHPPQARGSWLPAFGTRWRPLTWAVPVAAALIAGAAFLLNPRPTTNSDQATQAIQPPAVVKTEKTTIAAMRPPVEDQQILDAVAVQAPMMKASYEDNLRSVNAYIHDAEASLQQDPTDQEARQYLMEAYEQKAMLYDMALNRSLR